MGARKGWGGVSSFTRPGPPGRAVGKESERKPKSARRARTERLLACSPRKVARSPPGDGGAGAQQGGGFADSKDIATGCGRLRFGDARARWRYHDDKTHGSRQSFPAGKRTSLVIKQNDVYALKNVTVWVESHSKDGSLFQSENRTLLINEAVKLESPPAASLGLSRSKDSLIVQWSESHQCENLARVTEVRRRLEKAGNWTRVSSCHNVSLLPPPQVTCVVEKSRAFEMQVRYRTSHWSSYWSDWSDSVFVPAEILRSPNVTWTTGRLGEDGLRNVTLEWERPGPEEGEVTYTLTFALPPCPDCQCDPVFTHSVVHRTSYVVALSGAGYNVSLEASNRVSQATIRSFLLPPAWDAGPTARNVSLAGGNFSLQWEAKGDADGFCFEKQALGDPPSEALCLEETLEAGRVYGSSGVLEHNRCYRLAVHGCDSAANVWSTFLLTHLFARNTSQEGSIPVRVVKKMASSALISWTHPQALYECPGVLQKYVLCCQNERDGQITYYEANASETQSVLPDLQPDTAYRVGVWASTEGSQEGCQPLVPFTTPSSDARHLTQVLLSMGLLYGVITASAAAYHLGRKRLRDALCPALPDPASAEAVKIFAVAETSSQAHPPRCFVEPLESSSSTEPFVVDPRPEEAEPAEEPTVGSPEGLVKTVEEVLFATEEAAGSGSPLPYEYKVRGLLSPTEEDPQGQEQFGEEGKPS
ncbi:hypothetical protein JRQ81_008845 [Phrynocephalus forsythii]|uniref:Fibronectin type-III domain-containing protein n=1 Tax=Phrynocephalus forsythii TaxID=171643 RepID=A0A9Q0XCT8_9SAUR|nr:hypothetical protein JRQ81_008845 [Phrynocephalus forsythii]